MKKIEKIFDYLDNVKLDYNSFNNGNCIKYEIIDEEQKDYYKNVSIDKDSCIERFVKSDFYDDKNCNCYIDIYNVNEYLTNYRNYDYNIIRIEIERDCTYSNYEYVIRNNDINNVLKLINSEV